MQLPRVLQISNEQSHVGDHEIIHGKDLACLVSWFLDIEDEATSLVLSLTLAMIIPQIRNFPNLASVSGWMRGDAADNLVVAA